MGELRDREPYCCGSVNVELDKEGGPFWGTPSLVQAIFRAGLLMLSKARRMSQEETRHAVRFFGVFKCVDKEEGGAVSAMVGAESMLRRVEYVLGLPCGADAVGEYAGP